MFPYSIDFGKPDSLRTRLTGPIKCNWPEMCCDDETAASVLAVPFSPEDGF